MPKSDQASRGQRLVTAYGLILRTLQPKVHCLRSASGHASLRLRRSWRAANAAGWEENFDYDPIGNWQEYVTKADGVTTLDQIREHTTTNEIFKIDGSSASVAYDPAGNMTQAPPVPGKWSDYYTLVWDAWNRLVEVKNGETTVATYEYDGLFRRTRRTVAGSGLIDCYYNAQWKVVSERTGTGSTVTDILYQWGIRYRDDLVQRTTNQRTEGGGIIVTSRYALHDYYNVTAITDAGGGVLERYGYSGFGETRFMAADYTEKGSSDQSWEVLYKAQFRDFETGYYNYGYRYYLPALGRWPNQDPIGVNGGFNLYEFVSNSPMNGNDIGGLVTVTGECGVKFQVSGCSEKMLLRLKDSICAARRGLMAARSGAGYAAKLALGGDMAFKDRLDEANGWFGGTGRLDGGDLDYIFDKLEIIARDLFVDDENDKNIIKFECECYEEPNIAMTTATPENWQYLRKATFNKVYSKDGLAPIKVCENNFDNFTKGLNMGKLDNDDLARTIVHELGYRNAGLRDKGYYQSPQGGNKLGGSYNPGGNFGDGDSFDDKNTLFANADTFAMYVHGFFKK